MPTIRRPRGFVPREQGCTLPPEFASEAVNLKLSTGRFEAWRQPVKLLEFPFDVGSAHVRECCWAATPLKDARYVDVGIPQKTVLSAKGQRPVWTDSLCDQSWCYVGYPIPDGPVGVVDSTDSVDGGPDTELRRYRLTYGTECEEGPASCPSEGIVANKDTRVAVALPPAPDEGWCATHVHIYRQAATWDVSQGLVSFEDNDLGAGYASVTTETGWFKVASLPIAASAWVDEGAESGSTLTTEDYFPPAEGLEIVGETTSGSMVGFVDNTVWFSYTNIHYAFPLQHRHSFEDDILDVCIDGASINVLTCQGVWRIADEVPQTSQGCRPASQIQKSPTPVGDRCAVCSPIGCLYIAQEGLARIDRQGSVSLVSRSAFGKDDWTTLDPSCIQIETACRHLFLSTGRHVYVWELAVDESGQLPADLATLDFLPELWLKDEKGALYFVLGNVAYEFDAAAEHLSLRWEQTDQVSQQRQRLSSVYAQYLKKNPSVKNNIGLTIRGKPVICKPLREGFTRLRGQASDCYRLRVEGTEPMCELAYGPALLSGGSGE